MIASMTEGEFLSFSQRVQHKKAALLLRNCHEQNSPQSLYQRVEKWLGLPCIDFADFQALSDRYHLHLAFVGISWQEHNLLTPSFHQPDRPSSIPILPISIYLDSLRSAFNVGSILRTAEAFRLGTVHFSARTPFIDNPKVQKTSMWAYDKVPCYRCEDVKNLPRPLIALETDPDAPSLFDFSFPPSFTLLLGNEEYGLSHQAKEAKDALITIPLYGYKNSLNVASAFAIAAAVISHQLRD